MRTLTLTLFGLMLAASAQAATHRTFVSSDGTDSGACGPTAPCRTFAYALSQTTDGGEVIIVKSGGYGSSPSGGVIINQSVSIISEPGVFAALAPTAGNYGISIGTPGINVAIKGLTINGRGGIGGIHMTDGASLDLENVTITNFPDTGSKGLYVQTQGLVTVKNSMLRGIAIGIEVGSGANLMVSGTKLTDVSEAGILIRGDASSVNTSEVTVTDTLVRCASTLGGYGFDNFAVTNAVGKMYLDRVTATNCNYGVMHRPTIPDVENVVAISNSFVTRNNYGLFNEAGNTFLSSGNNHVANNGTANTSGVITTGTILH